VRERAVTQLSRNKSRSGELRKNGREYLLSGLVRCGICGQSCTGLSTTNNQGKKYIYYGCSSNRRERRSLKSSDGGRPPHRIPNIPADWLEGLVWTDVRAFLEDPGEVLERLQLEEIDTDATADELKARHADLTKRLAAKNAERDRYVRAYAQGHISEEELADYMADIKNQVSNLRLLISSVEDEPVLGNPAKRLRARQNGSWRSGRASRRSRQIRRRLSKSGANWSGSSSRESPPTATRTVIEEWRSPTDSALRLRIRLFHLCETPRCSHGLTLREPRADSSCRVLALSLLPLHKPVGSRLRVEIPRVRPLPQALATPSFLESPTGGFKGFALLLVYSSLGHVAPVGG
jgi:hypothetical protein